MVFVDVKHHVYWAKNHTQNTECKKKKMTERSGDWPCRLWTCTGPRGCFPAPSAADGHHRQKGHTGLQHRCWLHPPRWLPEGQGHLHCRKACVETQRLGAEGDGAEKEISENLHTFVQGWTNHSLHRYGACTLITMVNYLSSMPYEARLLLLLWQKCLCGGRK